MKEATDRLTRLEEMPPETVFNVGQAASYLRCSTDTIYDLIRSGRLIAVRLGKQRVIRIKRKALDNLFPEE